MVPDPAAAATLAAADAVPFSRLVWWSTIPVIKVFIMGLCGAALARQGVLDSDGRRILSRLTFVLFTPCLTFDKLAPVLSADNLLKWMPLPINVALSVAVGLALGAALAPAAPPWFRRHVVAATGLGNVGNLPLVLVAALVHEAGGSLGQDATVERGVAYVALGIVVANFSHL
ncbi:hypothetical protein MNEG_13004 [Monoraphidium neglectum]|uniref:Auxin efflux carrier family protein n=1 Tax=Monoraphidium neglectum TaxID=145388 RepID=A0A0D2KGJ4_9CHLO|nr:hypothetical protein MNEG_13004 [Monoraphidium neglectum]KIY94958.1 hypothetical protein MNEG_13004 [Monoraphidium neglectum]|eukprot:XP_013893978.1 hypothetical protein MNEG_13004 [Monoraphidium neglectum]